MTHLGNTLYHECRFFDPSLRFRRRPDRARRRGCAACLAHRRRGRRRVRLPFDERGVSRLDGTVERDAAGRTDAHAFAAAASRAASAVPERERRAGGNLPEPRCKHARHGKRRHALRHRGDAALERVEPASRHGDRRNVRADRRQRLVSRAFPASLVALRQSCGSLRPTAVVLPTLLSSLLASATAVVLCLVCIRPCRSRSSSCC